MCSALCTLKPKKPKKTLKPKKPKKPKNLKKFQKNLGFFQPCFCSASDVNKLDTILSTDANVSITAVRPHRVSLNTLDMADESLFHTVISDNHHVSTICCQLSKANDTGLGLELTVLPWRANHPFMITVII